MFGVPGCVIAEAWRLLAVLGKMIAELPGVFREREAPITEP